MRANVALLTVTARVPTIALRAREEGFPLVPGTVRINAGRVLDYAHVSGVEPGLFRPLLLGFRLDGRSSPERALVVGWRKVGGKVVVGGLLVVGALDRILEE